jgi:ribosomal protein L11 methyltransferase
MAADQYLEIYVSHLSRKDEDLVSGLLFSQGALGVSEKLDFTQSDVRFNPQVKFSSELHLIAYFAIDTNTRDLMETIKSHFPAASVTVIKADNKDWLEEWKKGYEAFRLTGDIWVVPSWKPVPVEAKLPLFIDPGMAFGTGTHETTQICSTLVAEYLQSNKCETAFDVGTGTGILALLMSKLGVPQITCSDIDEECRRVSQENFENNKATNIAWSEDFSRETGTWDLIVANIIDGVLLDLKTDFRDHAGPNTHFILSGILHEREDNFIRDFLKDWPLKVRKRFAMKEWVGFWLTP